MKIKLVTAKILPKQISPENQGQSKINLQAVAEVSSHQRELCHIYPIFIHCSHNASQSSAVREMAWHNLRIIVQRTHEKYNMFCAAKL